MSRFKRNFYSVERFVFENHKIHCITNEDGTLFAGSYKTKIYEEDLPEWYVFGRFYKRWGFFSTKGITDLVYVPNLWINHFLKDDCLLVAYGGKIEPNPDPSDFEKYVGFDERVWGNEILDVLKGAEKFSGYDISEIVEQIREKKRILIEKHPDEFGSGKWDFDIDKWLTKEYTTYRPTYFSRESMKRRKAELEAWNAKHGEVPDEQ